MEPQSQTKAQRSRQKARSYRTGQYEKHNECELCGKSAGENYASDERCNDTGLGVCLCGSCADYLLSVSDADYEAAFTKGASMATKKNQMEEIQEYRDAENGEILDAIDEHGLKIFDADNEEPFRIIRRKARGKSEEASYIAKMKTPDILWALERHKKYAKPQGKELKAIDDLIKRFENAPTAQRGRAARDIKLDTPTPFSVQFKSTNPKNPENGKWKAFLTIPLDLYQDSLGLQRKLEPKRDAKGVVVKDDDGNTVMVPKAIGGLEVVFKNNQITIKADKVVQADE